MNIVIETEHKKVWFLVYTLIVGGVNIWYQDLSPEKVCNKMWQQHIYHHMQVTQNRPSPLWNCGAEETAVIQNQGQHIWEWLQGRAAQSMPEPDGPIRSTL